MKFDIALAVPGLPFDGKSATLQSLGGSETAGYYMARELARLGHRVRMFCNCNADGYAPGTYDGVQYFALSDWDSFARYVPHDVSIVQRAPGMFSTPLSSRLNWLWCHDLPLGRQKSELMGTLWNIDRVLVLSDYMHGQYKEVYGLPESVLMRSRNGIDLSLFVGMDNVARSRKRLIYTARPERGVDNLLRDIFPALLREEPELELHLAGYLNQVGHLAEFYASVDTLIKSFGSRVTWHGALGKRALYELYASGGMYVYPTPSRMNAAFAEISCITVMEAQAAGLPVVATNKGALNETLAPGAGVLIEGEAWTPEYQKDFVREVLELVRSETLWERASAAGKNHAARYAWAGVAEQWAVEMEKQIRAMNADPDTLASHFWRNSDIMAAKELIRRNPGAVDAAMVNRIETGWAFTESVDAYREQYEKIGATHGPNIGHEVNEPRFQMLEQRLREHPECDRIVDYGCAYGNYLLNLVLRLPDRQWVGIDVDKNSIALAKKHAERLLTEEQRASVRLLTADREAWATFKTGPADTDVKRANALVLFEVLEHVMDPTVLIERVEELVEPGGRMFITVPFGPWEYDSYRTYPHRCHLWEFDWHDLRDMFGDKRDVVIAPMFYGLSQFNGGQPLGWWAVEYVVDPEHKTGRVDMDRKLWCQRPRQTVSATLLAGPNSEDNLHWCLKSLEHLADEVVLMDCGMSEEAVRIARQHGEFYGSAFKLIPGVDPKVEGFDTPRNAGLAHCTKDFVFWLDTDEKLLGTDAVHKYLRQNAFNGLCLKQCHFACDTTFEPDTPVRLFRNPAKSEQTRGMRWYGMIHEHPELAMNKGPGLVITLGDAWIPHVGYLNEDIRRDRFARNYPLLQKDIQKYPDRLLQKHFIIRDQMLLTMHELQRNGGRVTDAMKGRCREVLDIYRKYFRGASPYASINTLQYVSQACQVMGIGVEMAFQVAASKTGTPQVNGAKFYRFASMEDFEAELRKEVQQQAGALFSEAY